MSFASMRAKTRDAKRVRLSKLDGFTGLEIKGPYDELSCHKTLLPKGAGVVINIVRTNSIDFGLDIVDAATDEPLSKYSPELKETFALMDFFLSKAKAFRSNHIQGESFINPFSEEQERVFWREFGEQGVELYPGLGLTVPPWVDLNKIRFIDITGNWRTGAEHFRILKLTHRSLEPIPQVETKELLRDGYVIDVPVKDWTDEVGDEDAFGTSFTPS